MGRESPLSICIIAKHRPTRYPGDDVFFNLNRIYILHPEYGALLAADGKVSPKKTEGQREEGRKKSLKRKQKKHKGRERDRELAVSVA